MGLPIVRPSPNPPNEFNLRSCTAVDHVFMKAHLIVFFFLFPLLLSICTHSIYMAIAFAAEALEKYVLTSIGNPLNNNTELLKCASLWLSPGCRVWEEQRAKDRTKEKKMNESLTLHTFITVLLLLSLPLSFNSTTKVFKNSQRPDGCSRRSGILHLPGDWWSPAQDRMEQEGEESEQPEIWGNNENHSTAILP